MEMLLKHCDLRAVLIFARSWEKHVIKNCLRLFILVGHEDQVLQVDAVATLFK